MLDTPRKTVLTLGAAVAMVALAAGSAMAAGDTDDSLSPASTTFTITNSGNIKFTGAINGISVTVTCTSVKLTAKTRASGLIADVTSSPPVTFSGCTDSFFGTDTVTTSGTWTLTEIDAANDDTSTEPTPAGSSGDQLAINIPQGGATFKSSALSGCTVTANASNPTSSSFNDQNSATFTSAPISVTGSGCSASQTKLSGKFVSNINVGDLTS